jgi:hypothetical protein
MSQTDTPTRTRLAGASLTAGAVLLAVPPFLGPPNNSDTTADRLRFVDQHATSATLKSLLFQIAVVLLLPGVVAIIGRVRGRGAVAVLTGGAVYAAGMFGAFSFVLMEGSQVTIARSGPVTDDVVRVTDALEGGAVVVPMFLLAFLCFHLIGLPWLSFGLVRARLVPWWLAVLATAGTLAAFFGSGTVLESAGWVLTAVALILLAWRTLLGAQLRATAREQRRAPVAAS